MRTSIAILIAVLGGVFVSGQSDDKKNSKANQGVLKLAESLGKAEKNDAIQTQAKAIAQEVGGLDEIMVLFRPRGRGGVGFGPPKGVDGIDYFLTQHAFETPRKQVKDALEKQSADMVDLALRSAAIAEVLGQVDAKKKFGAAKVENWNKGVQGLKETSLEMVKHAREKKAVEMLTSLQKMHAACTACHYHFRQ